MPNGETSETIQPTTFKDATFVSTVIGEMSFNDTSANNLITNLDTLFTQIEGFTDTGIALATEITKAKSAAYELSLFGSVLDVAEIEAGISSAEIGVLEQPTITDASNVTVETNDSFTILNTVIYESSVDTSSALVTVPSYYDDYVSAITISNDTSNSILTIHYDETTQAIEKRLENLTDTLTVDDVINILL